MFQNDLPPRMTWLSRRPKQPLRSILHERDAFDHGEPDPEDWDPLAVFDPEAGKGHSVSRDVVTGEVI
jgi:hypothetical protein